MSVELLAPAGNYEKLETALYFGADAVYLGGKNFSLRTFADNFTLEELKSAVELAHSLHKKIYVTVNILARNADFALLEDYIKQLSLLKVDGVIVSDVGVVYLIKKVAPSLTVHLSTQANTTNKYAVKFWQDEGVARVILARELSLKEIEEIHAFTPEMELEAFVHGAMCISYSGRCLLSDYLDGRSSNRGACVQSCRWRYEVRALNATNGKKEWLPIEQDDKGTYIFNSKDLNMLLRLDDLKRAGVNSYKIEGRMKSSYYLATVINAYRRAIDKEDLAISKQELLAVAHREYTEAYADGKNADTVNYTDSQSKGEYVYIADVIGYENGFAYVQMRNRFFQGDVLEVLSPTKCFLKRFTANEIYNALGERVEDCKLVCAVYKIACPYPLQKGDFLRRKVEIESKA